jgi:microcystin-dependent protein
MPSTYSTSLRLELIGNGEQAANWGNTTNTNLGTLIEQAIAGVQSVAMTDANYTLVSGNGVSDEARNAVVIMTGTLTATRNVVVPTARKFYAVRNATTGGQSIVVKTSAGTGVTLANGFTQLMYCDGTNVVLASVPINSSNGNVAVGGTLDVTGNTTMAGNLAVTGSVSSGGGLLMPTGAMLEYGGSAAPTGWLICDGSAISRTTYAALFAVLGTAYGVGDGSTTFNVPDRRGKFGVGVDGTYTRGSTGGSTTTSSAGSHNHTGNAGATTLSTAQIPSHTHTGTTTTASLTGTFGPFRQTLNSPDATGSGVFSRGTAFSSGDANAGSRQTVEINMNASHNHTFTSDATGGGGSHDHTISTDGTHTHTATPPYVASNFIIKT